MATTGSTEFQPSTAQSQLGLDQSFIRLKTKPNAQISFNFIPPSADATSKPQLIVFLNGLGLPKAAWFPVISGFILSQPHARPAILAYDRYGQGATIDRDPADEGAQNPMHAHDCMSVVYNLRQLIQQIAQQKMGLEDISKVALIFVANSIGCAIARLYTQEYPGSVVGMLLLDSVLANSDFVSIFPDPDDDGFDEKALPEGITGDLLKEARQKVKMIFHPDNGSKEGLSRKNLRSLLLDSDSPVLKGFCGRGPYVTVVGHDFETFAEQSEKQLGIPKTLTVNYSNPFWHKYNEGLTRITAPERSKGPIQGPGCGHFVQADNPTFVGQELSELVNRILLEDLY